MPMGIDAMARTNAQRWFLVLYNMYRNAVHVVKKNLAVIWLLMRVAS
jgi:hypothetical protein